MQNKKLIVALDVNDIGEAKDLVKKLYPDVGIFKVGLQAFINFGPELIKDINKMGAEVFLDLKLHDIPNTVANAIEAISKLDVAMLTIHASGGLEMMKKAAEAANANKRSPKVLAVTVLTSINEKDLMDLGVSKSTDEQIATLAKLALSAGCNGVVCSPKEASLVRETCGEGFLIVTPGIRPRGKDTNDQKRVATPKQAVLDGADYIVVGRPIKEAKDPTEAARDIIKEIA